MGLTSGCIDAPDSVLERLSEARRLAANLHVQFSKAADASNRAVMADTDRRLSPFRPKPSWQSRRSRATPTRWVRFSGARYSIETRLLEEFGRRFAEYRALDRNILELAVENTNLKAQRLSFGPAQEAADAFREPSRPSAPQTRRRTPGASRRSSQRPGGGARDTGLQAPHIAEAGDGR